MHIQVNTDRHIPGHDTLTESIRNRLQRALRRFSDRITRVEVHLSDQNSDKRGGSDDIRCLIETRIEGRQPTIVSHQSGTVKHAFAGAVGKAARQLESLLARPQPRINNKN